MHTFWRKPSSPLLRRVAHRVFHATGAGVLMMAMVSTVVGAQGQAGSVRVTPEAIVVDPATQTAKVQLINTTGDRPKADLTLQYAVPKPAGSKVSAADSAKPDSLAMTRLLSAWIKDVPKRVTLTPHETLTVTLKLAVPASLQPGEYSTYLIVRSGENGGGGGGAPVLDPAILTSVISSMFGGVVGGGTATGSATASMEAPDDDMRPFAAVKLVYRVGGRKGGSDSSGSVSK